MIWNKEIECAQRQEIEALKLEKLKKTVAYVYENVPFYKKRLDSVGITPDKIKTVKDIENIPFTTKDDLRENYPFGLFAKEKKDIVRIHASSGTTGKPTVVGYTKKDIEMWSECMARSCGMSGVEAHDVANISYGYGLFTGGLGFHYGLEKVGATVVPMSSGNTEKQLMLMQDFGATVLCSTPSYALYIAEVAEKMGIKKSDLKLKVGMFGAEGHTDAMRKEIQDKLGIIVTECYGLSEIVGPGVCSECTEQDGMHFNEDFFLHEIINPVTGEVLNTGDEGELVITNIDKEGLCLLRYRTRDITSFTDEPCKCGRTTMRMSKIKGRSDDMLIIKGVNVYPSQVESVIVGMDKISPHYQLVVYREGCLDYLEVQVELEDESLLDTVREVEALENQVRSKIFSILGLDCKIKLREPNSIERSMGKAKRVIDLRLKEL